MKGFFLCLFNALVFVSVFAQKSESIHRYDDLKMVAVEGDSIFFGVDDLLMGYMEQKMKTHILPKEKDAWVNKKWTALAEGNYPFFENKDSLGLLLCFWTNEYTYFNVIEINIAVKEEVIQLNIYANLKGGIHACTYSLTGSELEALKDELAYSKLYKIKQIYYDETKVVKRLNSCFYFLTNGDYITSFYQSNPIRMPPLFLKVLEIMKLEDCIFKE